MNDDQRCPVGATMPRTDMPMPNSNDYVLSIEELLVKRDREMPRLFVGSDASMRLALQEVCRALATLAQEPECTAALEPLCGAVTSLSEAIVRLGEHDLNLAIAARREDVDEA